MDTTILLEPPPRFFKEEKAPSVEIAKPLAKSLLTRLVSRHGRDVAGEIVRMVHQELSDENTIDLPFFTPFSEEQDNDSIYHENRDDILFENNAAVEMHDNIKGNQDVRVALLGDSSIDNIVWTQDYKASVSGQLRQKLESKGIEPTIHNMACDGNQLFSFVMQINQFEF